MGRPPPGQTRRFFPRIEAPVLSRPARLRLTPLPVSNISLGGMRVLSDEASTVGQVLEVDIFMPDRSSLTCMAEVVWSNRLTEPALARYDVGQRFVSAPPGFLHYINKLTKMDASATVAVMVHDGDMAHELDTARRMIVEHDGIDSLRVIMVADASKDHDLLTADATAEPWAKNLSFLPVDLTRGRSHAVNAAVEKALAASPPADFVYLLAAGVSPEQGAIRSLVDLLMTQADAGVAGSLVYDDRGGLQPTVGDFPAVINDGGIVWRNLPSRVTWWRRGAQCVPDATGPVPWVTATSALVRLDLFNRVGLFDERLYSHFAMADLCRRAGATGWKTWFVRESSVRFAGPVTLNYELTPRPDRPTYLISRRRYLLGNAGRLRFWIATLAKTARLATEVLVRRFARAQVDLLMDFVRYAWRGEPAGLILLARGSRGRPTPVEVDNRAAADQR